ncbi:hypothetical protein [Thermoproteus tenax]|uniref:Uncharacterized protein n=1 Tax=Thermoproteus tenax (strain ATCC 35583 / DSM 2078 / JCM 9277 / NBRC 100435 / Kra 1) TaxID=768679 RepID=G4RL32_THETK|nr:hypothetical protein [Thermoproteus tenax]CCC82277.1 hypothetical protein TTX_1656 [Thermoproteus tenax Kra 1]
MISVDKEGGTIKIRANVGGREYEAVGLRVDSPAVVGLLVIQMLRDGVPLDEICRVLKEALQHL